ncbi:IMPACT family protein [Microbacterium radiodurans]|uniref:YigZ family protein n=1 Tax=Microbacterium radiodurans TaxID=661398 RepID=A0A5J5IQF1_9MICO|nr:YigZ family protein [Microbacterium radiodurans]KAA9086639.1 YigZ family protein [Microbacterium radiodurans]
MAFTLSTAATSELVVRKSRFLGCVEPLSNRDEAASRIADLRRRHPDARHVCSAFLAGGHSSANDDGEPSGTAGRPMIEVLRHQQLEGVLATVVRYFGGVKLGAGGLVRAYTQAVADALDGVERIRLVRTSVVSVTIPYAIEGVVRREIDNAGVTPLAADHHRDVTITVEIDDERLARLRVRIDDASQGRARWS